MKEKSPFKNTTVHIRTISKAAGEFKRLTGMDAVLGFEGCNDGEIRLMIANGSLANIVYTSEPSPNWRVYAHILNFIQDAKGRGDRVAVMTPHLPTIAKKPKLFVVPERKFKPSPIMSREVYQALIEDLSDDILVDLLQLLKNEYDYMLSIGSSTVLDFTPDDMMRSNMDAVHRYIKVYQNHGGWEVKPKRNLKVVLKRYRMWVMQAVNKEYEAGSKVFPDKHNVVLA